MNTVGRRISNRGALTQGLLLRLQSSVSSLPEIQVPLRKERGPTDILQALERTINRDPKAPHYKFHDDPYLIPYSNSSKRTFALAQEAGKKAAMWIREKHSDLFQHREADPVIKAFLPKAVYTNKEDVSESILKELIKEAHVTDARNVYQLLNGDVSIETKQSLLELLCYYNNSKPESEEWSENRWFKAYQKNSSWVSCPDTEALFSFLKEQDKLTAAKAYNAMICGTSKFMNVDRAWALFNEADTNKIPLSIRAYNSIIGLIPNLKESFHDRRSLLDEMLQQIKNVNIQPDIETFNNSLKVASYFLNQTAALNLCRSIFVEFAHIGIEPSLTSYNYVLKIFYKNKETKSLILREILNEIEGKNFVPQDKNDSAFFVTAMEIAANVLEDPELGNKIQQLLLTGDNYNLIGSNFRESIYYRHYMTLQLRNRSIDDFMTSCYELLVPHIYVPDRDVMEALLSAVEANDPKISTPFLPQLWTHIVQFNLLERKDIVAQALNLMRVHCKPEIDSPLNKIFAEAGWTVWNFVTTQKEKRLQSMSWSGPILGDVAVLCLRNDDFGKCNGIISYLFNEHNSIIGMLEPDQINELFDACVLNCHIESAMNLVHYCSNVGFDDTSNLACKIWRNLSLNEWQENRLKSLVGPNVLQARSTDVQ